MRNATIHQTYNGWVVGFSHDKDVWEVVYVDYDRMAEDIKRWFQKHELPESI